MTKDYKKMMLDSGYLEKFIDIYFNEMKKKGYSKNNAYNHYIKQYNKRIVDNKTSCNIYDMIKIA